MSDQLVRAISKDGFVKAAAVSTRALTERARQIHQTSPVATAALGRLLAAGSMMGNELKGDGSSVTLRIKGDGPLGTLLVVADNEGNVRGSVQNPQIDLPIREDGKLDVGGAVGHGGTLTVIKDLNLKEPYVGSVELLGGEIAEDLASYFVESEQIPTACGLGVLVDRDRSVLRAGGYLIQLLPGAPEGIIDRLEKGIMAAGPVTNLLMENDDPESLLRRVMKDFELEILETVPVEYRCYCSRERMAAALVSLGRKQLTELAEDPNGIELTCQFCDSRQRFTPEEIRDGSYLEKVKPISASMWVDESSAPSVVAYGTHDKVQPYLASLRLKTALEENGVDFRYFELPHSGHGLQNDNAIAKQWMEAIGEYLDKYMPVALAAV